MNRYSLLGLWIWQQMERNKLSENQHWSVIRERVFHVVSLLLSLLLILSNVDKHVPIISTTAPVMYAHCIFTCKTATKRGESWYMFCWWSVEYNPGYAWCTLSKGADKTLWFIETIKLWGMIPYTTSHNKQMFRNVAPNFSLKIFSKCFFKSSPFAVWAKYNI